MITGSVAMGIWLAIIGIHAAKHAHRKLRNRDQRLTDNGRHLGYLDATASLTALGIHDPSNGGSYPGVLAEIESHDITARFPTGDGRALTYRCKQ